MSYNRNYKKNLSKIKPKTPREHSTILGIYEETSRNTGMPMTRITFTNGKYTFADTTMDNYESKWEDIVKKAQPGDGIMDLQETYEGSGIYSGDSTPMLVPKKEWEALQEKWRKRQERDMETKTIRSGLKVVERIPSDLSPEEISGLQKPQLITLNDDLVFEVGSKLQESDDLVNVNIIPGGLGLEIYGPKVWLVLAREKKNRS